MVVDTSVWIDFFNGHSSAQADRLARAIEDGELIVIPSLVYVEILQGLRSEREAQRIGQLLEAFDCLGEPEKSDYEAAAGLYRACRGKGATVRSTIDCVIAQLCLRENLPLLAKDRDYQAIAKHCGLRLV